MWGVLSNLICRDPDVFFLLKFSLQVGMPTSHLPVGYPGIARNPYSTEELPKNVAVVLNQGSSVMSMDFHPSQPTFLLG